MIEVRMTLSILKVVSREEKLHPPLRPVSLIALNQPCCCCWLRQSELCTLSYASASLSQESAIRHYPDLKPGGFGTAVRPDEEHRGPYLHVFSRSGTRAGVVADAPIRSMSWVDIDSRLVFS